MARAEAEEGEGWPRTMTRLGRLDGELERLLGGELLGEAGREVSLEPGGGQAARAELRAELSPLHLARVPHRGARRVARARMRVKRSFPCGPACRISALIGDSFF